MVNNPTYVKNVFQLRIAQSEIKKMSERKTFDDASIAKIVVYIRPIVCSVLYTKAGLNSCPKGGRP